ncbi:MAG: recombinase zinc beta ribbon domain-containing protein, partial [bacterium]
QHEGIIPGSEWVQVQNLLLQNKSKAYRRVKSTTSLLSGIIRCGNCGSFMRPKNNNKPNKDGIVTFSYMCELKEKSRRAKCSMCNAPGNLIDNLVIEEIKNLTDDSSYFKEEMTDKKINLQNAEQQLELELQKLQKQIEQNQEAIKNLVNCLACNKESAAAQYLIKQINSLDEENKHLKEKSCSLNQLKEQHTSGKQSLTLIEHLLSDFTRQLNVLDIPGKQLYLKSIIDRIIWDGKNIDIKFFGDNTLKK